MTTKQILKFISVRHSEDSDPCPSDDLNVDNKDMQLLGKQCLCVGMCVLVTVVENV